MGLYPFVRGDTFGVHARRSVYYSLHAVRAVAKTVFVSDRDTSYLSLPAPSAFYCFR